jgi:hypothetical protein
MGRGYSRCLSKVNKGLVLGCVTILHPRQLEVTVWLSGAFLICKEAETEVFLHEMIRRQGHWALRSVA